jgi:hypothetical protein
MLDVRRQNQMKALGFVSWLLLSGAAVCQEADLLDLEDESLYLFGVIRTVAFEGSVRPDFSYPWIPELDCGEDCIVITSGGGTGSYTYEVLELFPETKEDLAENYLELEVLAPLDHWSTPVDVYARLILTKLWEGKHYLLLSAPVWLGGEFPPNGMITNARFIRELSLEAHLVNVENPRCAELTFFSTPAIAGDLGYSVELMDSKLCPIRGVDVDDVIRELRQNAPNQ